MTTNVGINFATLKLIVNDRIYERSDETFTPEELDQHKHEAKWTFKEVEFEEGGVLMPNSPAPEANPMQRIAQHEIIPPKAKRKTKTPKKIPEEGEPKKKRGRPKKK